MTTYCILLLSVIAASSAAHIGRDYAFDQFVGDTPEVAAAKRQHIELYNQIRKLLPDGPEDDRDEYYGHHQHHNNPVVIHRHETRPPVPLIPEVDPSATQPRWTGPLADHKHGQPVKETPEVAEARRRHEDAYSKIRSVLPELAERYVDDEEVPQPRRRVVAENFGASDHLRAVLEGAANWERLGGAGRAVVQEPREDEFQQSSAPEELAKVYAAVLGKN